MPTIACASNFQRSSAGALRLGNTELQTQLSNIEFCSPEVETRSLEALEEAIAQPASLTRAIYSTAQPVRAARSAGGGGRSGPIPAISSLAILAITVSTAIIAAVRARVRTVRECRTCNGYGLQRCKLCSGKGTIEWEGKMAHREPCPMCLGRRFNSCTCCGGGPFLTRHLFNHKHPKRDAALMDQLQNFNLNGKPGSKRSRSSRWAMAVALALRLDQNRKSVEQDDKRELSDQFAEEVMTD